MLVHVYAYTPSHTHTCAHAPFLWLMHSGRRFPKRALEQATWGPLAFLFSSSVSLGKFLTSSSPVTLRHQNRHCNSTYLRVVGRTKCVNSCKALRKPPLSQKWPSVVCLSLAGFGLNFTSVSAVLSHVGHSCQSSQSRNPGFSPFEYVSVCNYFIFSFFYFPL